MSQSSSNGNLVLARRLGESITIGDDVQVTVVDLTSGKVRLAMSAPRAVQVLRSELSTAARDAHRDALPERAA